MEAFFALFFPSGPVRKTVAEGGNHLRSWVVRLRDLIAFFRNLYEVSCVCFKGLLVIFTFLEPPLVICTTS
jgi:hypothetical protein